MSICAPTMEAAALIVFTAWLPAQSGVAYIFSYSPSSVSFMHSQKDTWNKRRTSLGHPAMLWPYSYHNIRQTVAHEGAKEAYR